MLFNRSPTEIVFALVASILSLTVHEFAHAYAADAMGDDTPRRQGRLTLDPLAHIDWIGTVILPLFIPFGWAKPVQWNPSRIRRGIPMARAAWIVAIAGPLSNVLLAFLSVLGLALSARFGLVTERSAAVAILQAFGVMNVALAVFNMVPVPPLDGSRVVDAFIPRALAPYWAKVHQHSMIVFLVVLVVLRQTEALYAPMVWLINALQQIAFRIAGLS